MTNQTHSRARLTGSQAGSMISRWRTLTIAAVLAGGLVFAVHAQEPTAPQTAPQPATEQKPAPKPAPKPVENAGGKTMGGYQVHSMVDLGGRFAEKEGSRAMWA